MNKEGALELLLKFARHYADTQVGSEQPEILNQIDAAEKVLKGLDQNPPNQSTDSSKDIVPQYIIDSFYLRIKNLLKSGAAPDGDSVGRELKRIKSINGRIPDKIAELLSI